jgi:nicotinate-nucleotide adenylyltransferase
MRLAILGGTFNPVHVGHLFLAQEVQALLGYEAVVLVPANVPVHKTMDIEVGPRHRLRMLRLAVRGYHRFIVDDCELRRGGNSYAIDTVREVMRRYSLDGKPGLIIGDDLAEGFDTWKDAEELARTADLIVAHRKSGERVGLRFPYIYVENMLLPVSSSAIRERLRSGLPVRNLVPERVLRYIRRRGLYRLSG